MSVSASKILGGDGVSVALKYTSAGVPGSTAAARPRDHQRKPLCGASKRISVLSLVGAMLLVLVLALAGAKSSAVTPRPPNRPTIAVMVDASKPTSKLDDHFLSFVRLVVSQRS